jgi:hypothetical protein
LIRVTSNPNYKNRVLIYFAVMGTVWAFLVFPVLLELRVHEGGALFALLWFLSYAFLSITTAYAFTTYIAFLFVKPPRPLPELEHTPSDKSVALVCTVRNEEVGLYERLKFSLNGNIGGPIDFWLLSDSDESQEDRELVIAERLREDFTGTKIFYRRRKEHIHFKPGNLAEWLFCRGGRDYDYFFILDADALVTPGTIEKLLRKAEHPDNWDIWHFQCKTSILHDYTHFAHLQKIALEIHERLVFPTIYAICGQWISYGHSNLVNTKGFLIAMPPTDELSHDVWDAAALDRVGYRSVIAIDTTVYEEAPANFLVAHKRDKRWAQGSLSAFKLLGDSRVSLIQRFFVFQGGVQFLNNVVFSFWLLLQFWNMVFWGNIGLDFPVNFSVASFAMNQTLFFVTLGAMGTFLGYPFLVARTFKEVKNYSWGLLYSNLTMMNSLINGCSNVLGIVFSPMRSWVPMEKDPFAQSPTLNLFKKTLPTSLISICLWWLAWRSHHAWWIVLTSPMLLGGVLSPLICWWSGRGRCIEEEPNQEVPVEEEPQTLILEKVLQT